MIPRFDLPVARMHEPRPLTAAEREWIVHGDCPSMGVPDIPNAMPYICTLDAGHPPPHRAETLRNVVVASWEDTVTGTVPDWGTVVPVDHVGYPDSRALLALPDQELKDLITRLEIARYQGWRNHDNLWVSELLRMIKQWGHTVGTPDLTGALVLDYGCGTGVEALQYARAGAVVSLADLSQANVDLAARVLQVHGYAEQVGACWVIGTDTWPSSRLAGRYDVIHCAGVLHHIREPRPVLEQFRQLLDSDGEVRLMVYSDRGWLIATGPWRVAEPHDTDEIRHQRFIRFMDEVGSYATWYDEAKLADLCDGLFQVTRWRYITEDGRYAVAILEPR